MVARVCRFTINHGTVYLNRWIVWCINDTLVKLSGEKDLVLPSPTPGGSQFIKKTRQKEATSLEPRKPPRVSCHCCQRNGVLSQDADKGTWAVSSPWFLKTFR